MEDEEGAEDAEVRSIITSPDGPRPQQLRSGRDFWQLYEKGETLGRGHFAKVKLVRERSSGAFFAAKIVIKQHDDDLATESIAPVVPHAGLAAPALSHAHGCCQVACSTHPCRMRRLAAQSPGLANVDLAADLSPAGGKKRTPKTE